MYFHLSVDRPLCLEVLSRLIRKIISSEQKKIRWVESLCLRHANLSLLGFKSSCDPSKSLHCAAPRGHQKFSPVWQYLHCSLSINEHGCCHCFLQQNTIEKNFKSKADIFMSLNTVALWKDIHMLFLSEVWEHSPELKRNHGLSLSPLSFDCSYSIFPYMLFKLFCFLLIKYDAWPGRAVNRRCISTRVSFKRKVKGITESELAQVPAHYVPSFIQVGCHHHWYLAGCSGRWFWNVHCLLQ